MDARKGNIFEILNGNKQFLIPLYQRCYSWDIEQCERLWNDIVEMQKKGKAGHFIGSIVNITEQAMPTGVQKYMIIDGQQRITTLTLLLLRAMGQLVSGYLDFAERQAEREQVMTMQDWSEHLDRILTMSGEQLLIGNGSVSHKQAVDKATGEYKKYKARTLSKVEQDYFDSIKLLNQKTENK